MAALESEYFAAAAAYAGSIEPKYFGLFDYATRKIPYRIVIGTKDVIFPLDEVRATRDALKSRGFPVEYLEMPGQTHNYIRSAKEINEDLGVSPEKPARRTRNTPSIWIPGSKGARPSRHSARQASFVHPVPKGLT